MKGKSRDHEMVERNIQHNMLKKNKVLFFSSWPTKFKLFNELVLYKHVYVSKSGRVKERECENTEQQKVKEWEV